MNNIVYIVHCVDTEGPLYESIEATFKRIKDTFGIQLEPTYDNLEKLQNEDIPLKVDKKAVANMVKLENLDYRDSWDKIDEMLDEITSQEFRNKFTDSFGDGWIYNWFCMDHVGFTGENPRRRDMGYHNIFDHYVRYNKRNDIIQDMIQWHFHPLPIIKDAHRSGTSYVSSSQVFEILARKIIDRKWFPAVFRPGFHTERPDSNWFLEQWIPFDYANQAIKGRKTDQPDQAEGRFGDWSRAPTEWKVYHPHHDDYQKEGDCRRWIARCLNIQTRMKNIREEDIRDGFERAKSGKPALISFTNHDFRDMKSRVNKVRNMIQSVSNDFPDVKFKYCNAIQGMRKAIGVNDTKRPNFDIKINEKKGSTTIVTESKNDIFGPQPFFAIKTKTGEYIWQNMDFQGKNQWSYTFDFHTLEFEAVEKIGVAANTKSGVTEIILIDPKTHKTEHNILHQNKEEYK